MNNWKQDLMWFLAGNMFMFLLLMLLGLAVASIGLQ